MNIPYALQLAYGRTRLAVGFNVVSLAVGLPLCLWAVQRYGMVGATLPWLLANLLALVVGIPVMHRSLLRGQALRWYLRDNLPPLPVGFGIVLVFRAMLPTLPRNLMGLASLGLVSGVTLVACALASPPGRAALRRGWAHTF